MPSTCVVVLNWNQPAMTGRCLDHLGELNGPRPDVLVVDNGSASEKVAELAKVCGGRATLIRLTHNRGFAGGMNVGIGEAVRRGYELTWLLNNDAFPEPECLNRLTDALVADTALACVSPALFYPDGREQHAGARLKRPPCEHDALAASALTGPVGKGYYLTGTALLFRTRVLSTVGGFDPRFFAYWEEVDLLTRIASAGHRFRAVPEARCVHWEGTSTGGGGSPFAWHMMTRNRFLMIRKHLGLRSGATESLRQVAEWLEFTGAAQGRENPNVARAVLGGVWAAASGRCGKPSSLCAPSWLEPTGLRLCWRLARLARRMADRLDRSNVGAACGDGTLKG